MSFASPAVAGVLVAVLASAGADAPTVAFRLTDPRITESSGLAASARHPGVVYTHNDSGGGPVLFAVGPDGRTRATLRLAGAPARDWEAVALDPGRDGAAPVLWVGDIGDNLRAWPYVRVYRVVEPGVLRDEDVTWQGYRLVYPDGPHDAEALLVDPRSGRLLVVSKELTDPAVYAAPERLRPAPAENRLRRLAAAPAEVTDGAFSPDGSQLVLIGYLDGDRYDRVGGPAQRLRLPLRPQGESVTWTPDGSALLVGSEGVDSAVWRVPMSGDDTVSSPASPAASAVPSEPTSAPTSAASAPSAGSAAAPGPGVSRLLAGAALVLLAGVVALLARRRISSSR